MFQPSLFVEWGSGPDEVTPRYEEVLAGGRQARPPNRRRAAPLTLRLDAQGGFHLYSPGDRAILAGKSRAARTPVPEGDAEVVDFAAAVDGYHVLCRQPARGATLLSLGQNGVLRWRRDDLDPEVDRIALTGRGLFVSARLMPERLVHLDPSSGTTLSIQELDQVAMRPFAAPDGALVSATYFPEQHLRGVLVLEPDTWRSAAAVAGEELYGPLTRAFGTNAAHELYLFGPAHGDPSSFLLVIGRDARTRSSLPMDALVAPGPGYAVVAARFVGTSELQFSGLDGSPTPTRVVLPERLRACGHERLALVDVDRERAVFDLRDEVGFSADRVALRFATGAIEPIELEGDSAVMTGLQPIETWDVDDEGCPLVLVTSERGVTVVKIDLS